MKYRFLDEARIELLEAGRYYVSGSSSYHRARTRLELSNRAFGRIPKAAKRIDWSHRSYKLKRFPYSLVYRIEDDEIVVVAVAHSKRKPGFWRGR